MKNFTIIIGVFCLSLMSLAQDSLNTSNSETTHQPSSKVTPSFKKNNLGVSFQTKKWSNTEKVDGKHFMKDSGTLNGFKFDYRYDFSNSQWFLKSSLGHVISNNTTYDGAYRIVGTNKRVPYKHKGTNSITDLDLSLGKFISLNNFITAKISGGFYFRSLMNPQSKSLGTYDRQIKYQTFALKAGTIFSLSDKFFIQPLARYDHLIEGQVRTDLSDTDPNKPLVINKQKKGKGYRFDLGFNYVFKKFTLAINPYYRSWDIADSERNSYGMEPRNKTESIGLDIGVKLF